MCNIGLFKYGWQLSILSRPVHCRQASQTRGCVALEELRLRAKGANFSSVRPRASPRTGRVTTVPAAIRDFHPGVLMIHNLCLFYFNFIVCLYGVTGFHRETHKIHEHLCPAL